MRNLRYGFLLILAVFIWPVIAQAHEFNRNEGLFFNADNNIYRQKADTRPWQLISLPEQSKVKQSIGFDGQIWLVIEVGTQQYLYRQTRLLNFEIVDSIASATSIVLKQTDNNLIAFRQNTTEV